MEKNIYDLATKTQMQDEERILKADSGKEYNVSFVPALVNRKYFPRWVDYCQGIATKSLGMSGVQKRIEEGKTTDEDLKKVQEYKEYAEEGSKAGMELIIYVMKANGYDKFSEDELLENFSEAGMSMAIPFIMKTEKQDSKKKVKTSQKSS